MGNLSFPMFVDNLQIFSLGLMNGEQLKHEMMSGL